MGRDADGPQYRRRIVLKRRAPTSRDELGEQLSQAVEFRDIVRRFPGLEIKSMFAGLDADSLPQAGLAEDSGDAADVMERDLLRYEIIELPEDVDAADVLEALEQKAAVELAYLEDGPTAPPAVEPSDDPRSGAQGFLDPAPSGIDVRYAWKLAGGDGSGIGFVDLERGWTLDHEDLIAADIALISGINKDYFGHGTAVLGQVVAVDNAIGNIGIAPGCGARVVSQWQTLDGYRTPEAIRSAIAVMAPGDVLLLEAQTAPPGTDDYRPVEFEPAVFDAIDVASRRGIVVVEAAGNGGRDLDLLTAWGRRPFDRSDLNFRDSGAILVAAASSRTPHARSSFSNHGSRVDCYAWGDSIDTTGDGGAGGSRAGYTKTFGGTSGASPIVAGAAILIQSIATARHGRPLWPAAVRALLADASCGTPSHGTERIGSMPDLRMIAEQLIDVDPSLLIPDYP